MAVDGAGPSAWASPARMATPRQPPTPDTYEASATLLGICLPCTRAHRRSTDTSNSMGTFAPGFPRDRRDQPVEQIDHPLTEHLHRPHRARGQLGDIAQLVDQQAEGRAVRRRTQHDDLAGTALREGCSPRSSGRS